MQIIKDFFEPGRRALLFPGGGGRIIPAGRLRTGRPCRADSVGGVPCYGDPRRFTCSAGLAGGGGTRQGLCTRWRVARAGAVRPPGPAVQAIRSRWAWSCSPPPSGRRGRAGLRRFAGRRPRGLRLPRMIAAIFRGVNRPKIVPQSP